MIKYTLIESAIRSHLPTVFSGPASEFDALDWDRLMLAHLDHPKWESTLDLLYKANEVSGYILSKSCNPSMPVLCTPQFIPGSKENYFSSVSRTIVLDGTPLHTVAFNHRPHWTYALFEELYELERISRIEDDISILLKGAHFIADKSMKNEDNLALVSGPISTGGKGNVQKNLQIFHDAIIAISKAKYRPFNQMPFGEVFNAVHRLQEKDQVSGYHGQVIIDHFYEPLLCSGVIKTLVQLPGWETSIGACQEYEIASQRGIKIISLEEALQVKELASAV